MMIRPTPSLTHLALHVRDLEACVAFYRDFCAMGVVHERDDGAGWEIRLGHLSRRPRPAPLPRRFGA